MRDSSDANERTLFRSKGGDAGRREVLECDGLALNIAGVSHNMFNSHPVKFNAGVMEFVCQH